MVPLIEEEIVDKRKWIAKDDFIDLLAISQSTPGILAVNISIFIGYKLRGIAEVQLPLQVLYYRHSS